MIESVTVTNYRGESIDLDLRNPESSGFLIKSIVGLGPIKGTINITEVSSNDGGVYNSARIGKRNIVLDLRFLWKPTIEDVRLASYRYFPVKKPITLTFKTSTRIAKIDGYVESNSPNIFSNKEGAQISILCPDPYFRSVSGEDGSASLSFGFVEPYFEFAWDDDDYYYYTDEPKELSGLISRSIGEITYNGDDEVGMLIEIRATGTVKTPAIYDVDTDEIMRFNLTLQAGDVLIINTVRGQKRCSKIDKNGVSSNVLNYLDRDASWLVLRKGVNRIAYTAEDNTKDKIQLSITYDTIFGGI